MIIETHGLTKEYLRTMAVRGLDLAVPEGSISAFLGPNGSGKTTTIKMLLGMVHPTAGEAFVFGRRASDGGESVEIRGRIGYVSEDKRLYAYMTVAETLEFTRRFYPGWSIERERELLSRFALPLERTVRSLSKGMRTQLALVLALSRGVELLVLDEPGDGLDPVAVERMLEAVVQAAAGGATVFFSTHQIAEVERIADQVFILAGGRLVYQGKLEEMRESFRRIHVVFAGKAPLEAMKLPGVRKARAQDHVLSLVADANIDAIAARAADLGAISVDIQPVCLREIFLESVEDAGE